MTLGRTVRPYTRPAMKVAVFSSKAYDEEFLASANTSHQLTFFEARLDETTAVLAAGYDAICAFVNDTLTARVLEILAEQGVKKVALRSAGFNHVDLETAARLGIAVARVPAYSPHSVAEHTVGLMLALNRKIHRAHARVREGNFSLEGLLGFDLRGRTVGIIGTGKIGMTVAEVLGGFECTLIAYDPFPNPDAAFEYVALDELYRRSDVVTLHTPLNPDTQHLIDAAALKQMKTGVMLINTSRGALIDTEAVVEALKAGHVGYLGLDVYEEEGDLFFEDLSDQLIQDDVFSRLLTFPNVLITGHQAFFTEEALNEIAATTIANLDAFEQGIPSGNEVSV